MAYRVLQQDHLQRKSLESGCGKRYGYWRVLGNGEAEVRQLAGGCMVTREKWRMFFIFELGPYVDMA